MNLKIYIFIFIQIYILVILIDLLYAIFVKTLNKYKNEASEKDAISYRNSYYYLKKIVTALASPSFYIINKLLDKLYKI